MKILDTHSIQRVAGCRPNSSTIFYPQLRQSLTEAVSGWRIVHPAGTSKDSDKCDLSKDSEIAPLTLGSMENTTYFISHRKPI